MQVTLAVKDTLAVMVTLAVTDTPAVMDTLVATQAETDIAVG